MFGNGYHHNYLDEDENDLFWELTMVENGFTIRRGKYGRKGKVVEKFSFENEAQARVAATDWIYEQTAGEGFAMYWNSLRISMAGRGKPVPPDWTVTLSERVKRDATLALYEVTDPDIGLTMTRIFHLDNGDELVHVYGFCEADGIYLLNHESGVFSVEDLDGDGLEEIVEGYSSLTREERIAGLVEEDVLEQVASNDYRKLNKMLTQR